MLWAIYRVLIGVLRLEIVWAIVTGARTPGGTTTTLFTTGSENIATLTGLGTQEALHQRPRKRIAIQTKRIRTNIRRLVDMNTNKSQRVITDFFNPGTSQELDEREPNTVIDGNLLDFDLSVETLASSMPDPSNVINILDHLEILNRGSNFVPLRGRPV